MIFTAAELRAQEAHAGHPSSLTGRCNLGGCRRFPIQGHGSPRRPGFEAAGTVPWAVAELAYEAYAARYGRAQSLERMAERGGFGHGEMDLFAPGWGATFEARP